MSGPGILLIDEPSLGRDELRRFLERKGCQCACADTFREAVGMLEQRPVDAVVAECVLSDGNVCCLAQDLRFLSPGARVVVLTAEPEDVPASARPFVAAILRKPASRRDLMTALGDLVPGDGTQPSAAARLIGEQERGLLLDVLAAAQETNGDATS